jgi:D-glycero-D-manno-heptose 1,7-bisphosphate phosphatase
MSDRKNIIFLDRDGVVNIDYGYVHRAEELCYVEGIFETLQYLSKKGYSFIIVTNQSGIGRGYFSEDDFHNFMKLIEIDFKNNKLDLHGYYYCPHHPEANIEKYRTECSCRKPGTKMINDAINDYMIEIEESILIGDKLTDMECGLESGVGKIFLLGNHSVKNIPNKMIGKVVLINRIKQIKNYL